MNNTTYTTSQYLINSSHYVPGSQCQYKLRFPQGRSLSLQGDSQVAITSISIYNSTFNIKEYWGNNKLIIFSPQFNLNAATLASYIKGTNYTDPISGFTKTGKWIQILIPDGYYDINSLELFLQQQFMLMGFYFVSSDGLSNYYFVEALTNPQAYKCQISLFTIPSSLPSGFLMPSNSCFTLPSSGQTIQLYFPSVASNNLIYGNLGTIFGFNQGVVLPLNNIVTADSINLSTITPKVSPISTYIIGCSIVQNDVSIPPDVLTQLNLGNSKFGGIIPYSDYPIYTSCLAQQCSTITITLYDEFYMPLQLNDSQFSMILSIKTVKK
jgi:hypothetical protein